MKNLPIQIRPMREEDLNFIMYSWILGQKIPIINCDVEKTFALFAVRSLIAEILRNCEVLVACNPECDWHLYGYVAFSLANGHKIIHWGFVKEDFRNQGIFTELLSQVGDGAKSKRLGSFFLPPHRQHKVQKSFHIRQKPGVLNWILKKG